MQAVLDATNAAAIGQETDGPISIVQDRLECWENPAMTFRFANEAVIPHALGHLRRWLDISMKDCMQPPAACLVAGKLLLEQVLLNYLWAADHMLYDMHALYCCWNLTC